MKNCFYLVLMMSILNTTAEGQEPKHQFLGAFEYSLVSGIGAMDLKTYEIGLGMSVANKSSEFGFGVRYNSHQFSYFRQSLGFEESVFEKFHTLWSDFFYKRSFGGDWSVKLSLAPTISSNFEEDIRHEDFIPNANIGLSKLWQVDLTISELTLGMAYGTLLGSPRWYPLLSFSHRTNGRWSYNLGFPETQINYSFNEKHEVKARTGLLGLYANNSRIITFEGIGELANTKLQFNGMDIGLEYNYDMGTGFTTMVRAGYQRTGNLEVLDNQNNLLHDFEPDGTLYITMGLKYKLN